MARDSLNGMDTLDHCLYVVRFGFLLFFFCEYFLATPTCKAFYYTYSGAGSV